MLPIPTAPMHPGMVQMPPMHHELTLAAGKRSFDADYLDDGDRPSPKKKGRKKSFIWAHVITDEQGKVHCRHCGQLIRVNYGEKVERLRRHFVKSCSKSPFHKDSKEYEELLESVNAPQQENKKKSYIPQGKSKSNKVISYSVGFVTTILSGACMELTPEQVQLLESQGNRSTNWAGVKLTGAPTVSYEASLERIRGCYFSGNIYIGVFVKNTTMDHGVTVPCGLYNSNFSGTCVLSDNCYIWNTSMVSNVFVGRNSCLVNCGTVVCEGQSSYGTQRIICVGPESDSVSFIHARSITLNVNATYSDVCNSALSNKRLLDVVEVGVDADGSVLKTKKMVRSNKSDDYVRYDMTIICDDVEISHCFSIRNAFIGSYSRVNNSAVDTSTFLSHSTITSSHLTECVLHGSCSVEGNAILNGVLMFPHSHVANGAKVEECVLGPDSSVAVGECKRCLIGPFVGFHHQSLLIASCWPLGRGNVAYGSMIGANHTGRSNDQECLPGEGCFFGLGSSAKFPFNIVHSPYTLIAAGTNCLPQRISFPFSLISNYEATPGGSANTLRPGWVIWSNPYFIERNILKFSKRRKSMEYRTDFPVFRPSIVDLVLDARNRLLRFKQTTGNALTHGSVYINEQHLSGAGRCLVPLDDVDRAIDGYTHFIHRYALHGLLYMLATGDNCRQDDMQHLKLGALDSDSEEEDRIHSSSSAKAPGDVSGMMSATGPLAFILEDVRKMESSIGTIEDALLRGDGKKDGKRAMNDMPMNPNSLLHALIGRNGACCLLTDSHDFSVRRHQLKVLSEEFADIDFVKFIESTARGGIISYNNITAPMFGKMKQLLVRLVELERTYAEGVIACKQKDLARSVDIITGTMDRNEMDETIVRARSRAEEISGCVHRLLTQL